MSEDKSSIVMNTILAAVISAIANAIIFLGASRIAASRGIDALGGQDLITWNTANGTVNIIFVIIASVVTAIGAGIVYALLKRNDNTFLWVAAIVAVLSMAGPLFQAGPWFNQANVGYGDTVALGLMHIVSAIVNIVAHTYNNWKDNSVVNVPDFNYDRKLKTAGVGGASLAAAGAGAASLKASAPKVSAPKVDLKATAPKVDVKAPKVDVKAPKVEVKKPTVKVDAKAPAKKVDVKAKAAGAAATGAAAAGAAKVSKPAKPAKPDDLTKVEGIGPKIASLLKAAGINTFAELAKTDVSKVQSVLDAAGPRFKIAKPGTWPEQAALAAAGNWDGLKKLQDTLDGGVRK